MSSIRRVLRNVILLLSVGLTCLPAQGPPTTAESVQTAVGVVHNVAPNAVTLVSGDRMVTLNVNSNSRLWKGKLLNGDSAITPGDNVVARCVVSASGDLNVTSMWINAVAVLGKIVAVAPGRFTDLTNPNADPASAYKKEIKTIGFDTDTNFEASKPEDLWPGREVEIIGVSLDAHTIRATKLVVYEGKQPTRMQTGQVVIGPNGRPVPQIAK
jgi:hypothetical protein